MLVSFSQTMLLSLVPDVASTIYARRRRGSRGWRGRVSWPRLFPAVGRCSGHALGVMTGATQSDAAWTPSGPLRQSCQACGLPVAASVHHLFWECSAHAALRAPHLVPVPASSLARRVGWSSPLGPSGPLLARLEQMAALTCLAAGPAWLPVPPAPPPSRRCPRALSTARPPPPMPGLRAAANAPPVCSFREACTLKIHASRAPRCPLSPYAHCTHFGTLRLKTYFLARKTLANVAACRPPTSLKSEPVLRTTGEIGVRCT